MRRERTHETSNIYTMNGGLKLIAEQNVDYLFKTVEKFAFGTVSSRTVIEHSRLVEGGGRGYEKEWGAYRAT
jgi:hypothetical protein